VGGYTGNDQKMIVLLVVLFPLFFVVKVLVKGRFSGALERHLHTWLTGFWAVL